MNAGLVTSVVLGFCLITVSGRASGETLRFEAPINGPRKVSGALYMPASASGRAPVVILIHGTAGPDSRYDFHRGALLRAGFAVFQVDFKSGVFHNAFDRPRAIVFLPAVEAAAARLRADPRIDSARIGVAGFSLGAAIAVIARGKVVYKAAVAFYPGCKFHRVSGSTQNEPLLILTGSKDSYGDGESCEEFARAVGASVKIYPGVYHGFDRAGQVTAGDPNAIGGTAVLRFDAKAANDARERMVAFFREHL